MSPLEFRATTEGAPAHYPGFAIPAKPPRAGFPTGTRRNLSYAARAKLLLAVKAFPSVLPGTRGPGHAATASLTPSKPVAPELERYLRRKGVSTLPARRTDRCGVGLTRCNGETCVCKPHAIST